jgi:queuine/archaeosine tRNA-ribosyltransferase
MKFFYADALDYVDPEYNFSTDSSNRKGRIPQRDDAYAHELFENQRPYDGLLISKYLFDLDGGLGRYSQSQRLRFMRTGARDFLRLPKSGFQTPENEPWPILGDCGAFNYRLLDKPPYTTEEMFEFYDQGGFTYGVSIDHMIGAYDIKYDQPGEETNVPENWQNRFEMTLDLADEFLIKYNKENFYFKPIGIAQGWSPLSYQKAVRKLKKMGYQYIGIGGLVPLKTKEILEVLSHVQYETHGNTPIHLFGITRLENFNHFYKSGVRSLDSASPMRQAFKDAKNNYYSTQGHYTAIRIPQADKHNTLKKGAQSGLFSQYDINSAEKNALDAMYKYSQKNIHIDNVIENLQKYEKMFEGSSDWKLIRRTLEDRPWERCSCSVCQKTGIDIIIFRCYNRNKRRGFHNMWHTYQIIQQKGV